MVGMNIQGCSDRYFGNNLCCQHVAFMLVIMFVMDLVLFFLDTFLSYVTWNTVISIGCSFVMAEHLAAVGGYLPALPKRIYAKLLATGEMESKYKPKVRVSHLLLTPSDATDANGERTQVLVSQIWNTIIISMCREHLLSIEHL
jgi:1,3-beta-glucan synthase